MLEHESGVLPSMATIDESIHIGMQPVHQVRTYTGERGGGGKMDTVMDINYSIADDFRGVKN